jgi:hypothetical protein
MQPARQSVNKSMLMMTGHVSRVVFPAITAIAGARLDLIWYLAERQHDCDIPAMTTASQFMHPGSTRWSVWRY